jgi:Flp pilus assembly pilin Flp
MRLIATLREEYDGCGQSDAMLSLVHILKSLHADERGVTMVEYLEILILVTLGAAVAMAPLGAYLMRYYDNVEFLSGLPFP